MAVVINPQDVTDAEDFLVEYMTDKIDDGDYTEGSALRDLAIKAIAYTFAFLRKTNDQILARQSLKSIEEVDVTDDSQAADDAVDEILSNWFAERNRGRFARVMAYGTASTRVDITVSASAYFYRTADKIFILDNNGADQLVAAEELVARFDSDGEVTGYTFKIPLVATTTGVSGNIEPGVFVSFDNFSPYVTKVETLEKGQGGTEIESTTDFIARSKNLITVRNLINARSCDAVLRDTYSSIKALTVVGMGDPEMIRDRVAELVSGLEFHTGGHQDIYIDTDTVETSVTLEVGAKFTRPDGVINVFRDPTYADGVVHKFTDADPVTLKIIEAGMSLRIWDGLPQNPHDYIIREVRDTELIVSERVPFPAATDETATNVTWSVGQSMPNYQDVVGQQLTGETSQQIQHSGRVTLPGGPLYRIKDVTINDPADPNADPTDQLIHFNVRVNDTPEEQVAPDNQYQVLVHNGAEHQSSRSFAELIVGFTGDTGYYDGKLVKVTYDTLSEFATISNFVDNRWQRVSAANPLVKAYHPIYLSFTLEYKLKKAATSTVDAQEAVELLANFINSFDPTEVIDVSTISDFFKTAYSDVSHVYPFVIGYHVYVPDGRVVAFETTEAVTVPSDSTQLAALQVYPGDPIEGLDNPLDYGLTDDVMRYVVNQDDIVIQERTS